MHKMSGNQLFEEYMDRIYETNVDLEDADLERVWLQSMGWTPEEFDQFLADNPFLGE